jgi:hypothetical protein
VSINVLEKKFRDKHIRRLLIITKAGKLLEYPDMEIGDVGIPAFVFEDGRISIDPADAGLIEYGTPDACSIEDHKSGRKGC